MKNFNKSLIILAGALLVFVGCSKEAKQQDAQSSGNGANEPLMSCSSFSNSTFSGRIQAYRSSPYSAADDRLMRLTLNSWPTGFESNANMHIKFYVWHANSNGVVILNQTPLNFNFEDVNYPGTPRGGNFTGTNRFNMELFNNSNIDLPINRLTFILAGTQMPEQVVKIVLYNDTTVVDSIDILMPEFRANPAAYVNQPHPQVLNQLHPFINDINAGYTSDDFRYRSTGLCIYSNL